MVSKNRGIVLVYSLKRCFRFLVFFGCLGLALSAVEVSATDMCNFPKDGLTRLRERIEFAVKWSFIPLVKTHMEIYQSGEGQSPNYYRLTHQAVKNTFWNDRMASIINSQSLLPCQVDTTIEDSSDQRTETVIFDRGLGRAKFFHQDREGRRVVVSSMDITPSSMDPLSAFYYLRKQLSPEKPFLELKGISGARRFSLRGKLVGEEIIDVPAGAFKTYRIECILEYGPQKELADYVNGNGNNARVNPFTFWVSQDEHRFPVQIRYHLALGSLWVRAISLQHYGASS